MADKISLLNKLKSAMVRFVGSIIAQYPDDQEFIFIKTFIC